MAFVMFLIGVSINTWIIWWPHHQSGIYTGNGSNNLFKSGFVKGFNLTPAERKDLLNSLQSLTDEQFLRDPRFSNLWKEESK